MSLLPAELRTFFKSSILMPKNDVVASNFSKEDLGYVMSYNAMCDGSVPRKLIPS